MKKSASLAVALAFLMVALAGCGGQKPAEDGGVAGLWRGQASLDEAFNRQLERSGMSEVAVAEGLSATVELELGDDGVYVLTLDQTALSGALTSAKAQVRQGLADHLEKTFQPQGVSLEDALAQAGTSLDQLAVQALGGGEIGLPRTEGRYALAEGSLALSLSPDQEPDLQQGFSYTLSGDTLTIDAGEGTALAGVEGLHTLTLQRVEP